MRSDHWNFLANLLGTPGSSQPASKSASKSAVDKPEAGKEKELTPAPARTETRPPAAGDQPAPAVEEVLEALQSAVPPAVLPGFSTPSARSPQSPSSFGENRPAAAASDQAEDLGTSRIDSAWSDLANELGIQPAAPPTRQETRQQEASPARSVKPQDSHLKPKKRTGGFGQGLGVDLGPAEEEDAEPAELLRGGKEKKREEREEPEEEEDEFAADLEAELDEDEDLVDELVDDLVEDIDDDEPWGLDREEWGLSGDRGRREHGPEPARGGGSERDDSTRRPRGRSERQPRSGAQSAQRPESVSSARSPGRRERPQEASGPPVDDESRPRRQVRQGARQRITEEELDRGGPPAARRGAAAEERGDHGRSRGPGRDRREEPAARGGAETRDREAAEPEELDEFGAGIPREVREGDEEAPRARSRRRGRRGKGRGRRREGELERGEATSPELDALVPESPFDDDHEDDLEVETLRRGRRHGLPERSREDRDGDRERPRVSEEEPSRARRPRSEQAAAADEEDDDEAAVSPRRRGNIPTWIETVEILVNANIENHKKSRGSNGGGGRGRGGRRR